MSGSRELYVNAAMIKDLYYFSTLSFIDIGAGGSAGTTAPPPNKCEMASDPSSRPK